MVTATVGVKGLVKVKFTAVIMVHQNMFMVVVN